MDTQTYQTAIQRLAERNHELECRVMRLQDRIARLTEQAVAREQDRLRYIEEVRRVNPN